MSIKPKLSADLSRTILIFQGEYASIEGEGVLKTSTPTTCHVVTVYQTATKKGFLAHIDDYTSVPNTIQKIVNLFLNSSPLEIKVLGGGEDVYSKIRFQQISSTLGALGFPFENPPLGMFHARPQITLNVETGTLTLIEGEKKSERLEITQKNEYGRFNDFLDARYTNLNGMNIPNFEAKPAVRKESDIIPLIHARTPLSKEKEKTILKELLIKILEKKDDTSPIKRAFKKNDFNLLTQLASSQGEDQLKDFLFTFKDVLGITINPPQKSPEQQRLEVVKKVFEAQIGSYGSPKSLLVPLVDGDWNLLFFRVSENPNFSSSFTLLNRERDLLKIDIKKALMWAIMESGLKFEDLTNYSHLFRQSAQNSECLPLLRFLVSNREALKLDIHEKESLSGSAIDLAIQANNTAAVAFLKEMGLVASPNELKNS